MTLSLARLKELLEYDPETGVFRQKTHRKGSGLLPGEVAGGLSDQGYVLIGIDYKKYRAHRLAWLWMTGEWPGGIDHINGDRTDNRWCNLRIADQSHNTANSRLSRANTTGFKGVSRFRNKWRADITKNRVRHVLGVFETPEKAHAAYCKAARELYGEFARAA